MLFINSSIFTGLQQKYTCHYCKLIRYSGTEQIKCKIQFLIKTTKWIGWKRLVCDNSNYVNP